MLGTIATVRHQADTFTMTVPNGAALVYVGQTIQMYDTTLTTNRGVVQRGGGRSDRRANHHRGRVPTGTIATDVIVHDGLSTARSRFRSTA